MFANVMPIVYGLWIPKPIVLGQLEILNNTDTKILKISIRKSLIITIHLRIERTEVSITESTNLIKDPLFDFCSSGCFSMFCWGISKTGALQQTTEEKEYSKFEFLHCQNCGKWSLLNNVFDSPRIPRFCGQFPG